MTHRCGLVGAGYFGAELGRIMQRLEGAKLCGIYSVEYAQALGEELGVRVHGSLRELLDSGLDAVIIASPNHAHYQASLQASRRGIHVFCEKPIALSYQQCYQMVEAANQAGTRFMAGHVMQFMHGVRRAQDLIADGEIGRVVMVHSARNGWEEPDTGEVSWKKRGELSGGHLFHHIHELDLVLSILGSPHTVSMVGGNFSHRGAGCGDEDDVLVASLEFGRVEDGSGAVALCEWGSAMRRPEHYVTIQGERGYIHIDLQEVGVELHNLSGTKRFCLHSDPDEDADRRRSYAASAGGGGVEYGAPTDVPPRWLRTIMEIELRYFIDLLDGIELPTRFASLIDGTAATRSIAVAQALQMSLAENRKVALAQVTGSEND